MCIETTITYKYCSHRLVNTKECHFVNYKGCKNQQIKEKKDICPKCFFQLHTTQVVERLAGERAAIDQQQGREANVPKITFTTVTESTAQQSAPAAPATPLPATANAVTVAKSPSAANPGAGRGNTAGHGGIAKGVTERAQALSSSSAAGTGRGAPAGRGGIAKSSNQAKQTTASGSASGIGRRIAAGSSGRGGRSAAKTGGGGR